MISQNTAMNDQALRQQPWWLSLPESFNKTPYMTDVAIKYRLKVQALAAVDGVLRLGLACVVLAGMTPHLLSSRRVKTDIQHLGFYRDLVDQQDREAIFTRPSKAAQISRERLTHSRYFPEGAQVELLRTPSSYQTLNPALRSIFAKSHQHIPATAQHWRHPDGPRPTLIFTHGFLVDSARLNSMLFSLDWFYQQGYDILLHTLPFHGQRRRKADLYSGMGYFSAGFAFMNEAILQGVYDLRVWMDYLESQGITKMGAFGFSFGGYITALTASCDSRLKFAIADAPAVLLIDMILGWSPINLAIRHMMKSNRLNLTELRHMTALHCPLTWQPVLSPERLMVIGGAGDRFTSPQFVNMLYQHWSGSKRHWFPGNHIMHLNQPIYLRRMKKLMDQACAD